MIFPIGAVWLMPRGAFGLTIPMGIILDRGNKVVANLDTLIVKNTIVNFGIHCRRFLNIVFFEAVSLTNFF